MEVRDGTRWKFVEQHRMKLTTEAVVMFPWTVRQATVPSSEIDVAHEED